MTTYCIIDIDTTIANNDHRAVLLQRTCLACGATVGHEHRAVCVCGGERFHAPQSSWDSFLDPQLVLADTPQPHAREVLDALRYKTGHRIVFLTGRNEKLREVTLSWLQQHMNLLPSEPVIMRPEELRHTPASQFKREAFLGFLRKEHISLDSTFLFFEDDRYVMGVWQKYGIVFQCPEVWQYLNPEIRTTGETAWNR